MDLRSHRGRRDLVGSGGRGARRARRNAEQRTHVVLLGVVVALTEADLS